MADENPQPESIADLDIRENVEAAINSLDIVRESDVLIALSVNDGVVTLGGHVLTRIMRRVIVQAAASVPGVKKVIDSLYVDSYVEMAVSQALATHPDTHTFQLNIGVMSYRGEVTFSGKVSSAEAVQAASAVASKVPGVLMVINRLTVGQ